MSETRRKTLLGLGAAGLGALVASCKKKWKPPAEDIFGRAREKPYVPGAERWATHEERWATTSCGQCPTGCGLRVRVVEGRAVRIEGDPENPINRGGVGARGLAGLQSLYDPDRIAGPMIRRAGELAPASWDEAIDAVVAALEDRRGEDLLILSGRERGMINDLFRRFAAAIGGARFVDGRSSHSGPIAAAMKAMFGVDEVPAYDWVGARTVLSLEAGLIEGSCQATGLARATERPRLIHASAAYDLAAHAAGRWIRIHPGTGGALALGLAHIMIGDGTYDRAGLERARGRAGFDALVARFTPERTAEITGVEPAAITSLARQLWRDQPSFAVVDERSVDFSNGVDTAAAALALDAVLGAVEAPSGGVRLPPEPPLRDWPAAPGEHVELADLDAALAALEAPAPPKVAMIHFANPAFTRARPERWRAALDRLDLVVSFSPFLDETTADLADVVLPDHTFLERREDAGAAPVLPAAFVGVRRPMVEPLRDTRASGDALIDIARRLGGPAAAAMPWRRFSDAVDQRLAGLGDVDAIYEAGGWFAEAPPPPRPIEPALPASWSEPDWSGDPGRFPLRLVVYRPLGHGPSSASSPWLQQIKGRPGDRAWTWFARVHPSSAAGFADGQVAAIASERGAIEMPIRHDHRVEPGVIAVPLGGGHTAFGRFARGRGANPIELLDRDLLCSTRVQLAPRGRPA
jgi:anaerobic selenocysteine-containing dehydrogenase